MASAHFQDLDNEQRAGTFAMWVFLSTELLFFAGLFMLYATYRAEYPEDFVRAAKHSKLALGSVNTLVLLTSSLFVALSVAAIEQGRVRFVLSMQALTMLAGVAFLTIKGVEYAEHFREGIYPGGWYRFTEAPGVGSRMFFTLYFVMTGLHALHVLAGIGLFAWLMRRTWKRTYLPTEHQGIDLVGLYWHFVDLIWIFLWPLFYLVR